MPIHIPANLSTWIIGALSGAVGFLAKSSWDRYWKNKEERAALAHQKGLEFLERQLSQFYWPLYLQLQKNNVIWEHLTRGEASNQSLKQQVDEQLYGKLTLANHEAMERTIESNIHLALLDAEVERPLLRLIRHISIFRALRQLGLSNIDPIALGEPWPSEVFPLIEARTRSLQKKYDDLLK